MKKWIELRFPKQKKTIYLFFIFFPLYFVPKEYGQTPLDTAAFDGHEQIIELLLEKGANVNSQRKVLFSFFFVFVLSPDLISPSPFFILFWLC